MPSARIRYAGEAAFLLLVALGLGLAGFEPLAIVVVMFVATVLVALFERAAREATRSAVAAEVKRIDVAPATVVETPAPAAEPEPDSAAEPEPEPSVDERSARAILASAPPPLPPETPKAKWKARRRVVRRPQPQGAAPPPAEPEPLVTSPPREWNLWEVERAVRDAQDEERREEWSALLIHLREFANPDGDLPAEFDGLVRESFGAVLAGQREPVAAP